MNREEALRILKKIEGASTRELDEALVEARRSARRNKGVGAIAGTALGAVAGAATGSTPLQKILRGLFGGVAGGGAGYGIGHLVGRKNRSRLYNEIKLRRDDQISDLLGRLGNRTSSDIKKDIDRSHVGIQSNDTDYGMFVSGKGSYSLKDRIPIKRDAYGRPVLSLLFAGINSSVEGGGPASAHSPFAARFYNKNRGKFSDVQANTIFDDPIVADAFVDKIVSKIMANRARTGSYPRIRLVGYSAGGRGVVNFLKKMRERDPHFKADEIIGIDAYQRPWEGIPAELRDLSNPVADKIVYSRPENKYLGSSQKGLGRVVDTVSNTLVALAGKQLSGLSGRAVIENYVPGAAHTDADAMYNSALDIISKLENPKTKKEKS